LADVTTQRLVAQANWEITQTNVETSGFTLRGALPHVADNDVAAVAWAFQTCAPVSLEDARIIRIRNTRHLESMLVSAAVLKSIAGRATIEVLGPCADFWASI
jgi:hypothetical protein